MGELGGAWAGADGAAFLAEPDEDRRLALLDGGAIEVADPLGPAALAAVAEDPLLSTVGGPELGIGPGGSARGSARSVPLLSGGSGHQRLDAPRASASTGRLAVV